MDPPPGGGAGGGDWGFGGAELDTGAGGAGEADPFADLYAPSPDKRGRVEIPDVAAASVAASVVAVAPASPAAASFEVPDKEEEEDDGKVAGAMGLWFPKRPDVGEVPPAVESNLFGAGDLPFSAPAAATFVTTVSDSAPSNGAVATNREADELRAVISNLRAELEAANARASSAPNVADRFMTSPFPASGRNRGRRCPARPR